MFASSTLRKFRSALFLVCAPFAIAAATPAVEEPLQQADQLASQGRFQEAERLLERARASAAKENREYSEAMILNALGRLYEREEKYLPAQEAFEGSVSMLTHAKGENDPGLIQPLNNLSELLFEAGQYSQAEKAVRRNLAIRQAMGENDIETGAEMGVLGKIYLRERKFALARQTAEDSLKILAKDGVPDGLPAAVDYAILGAVDSRNNRSESAEQSCARSLSILEKVLNPRDYRIGEALANLGFLYDIEGAPDKAEPLLERAHDFFLATALNSRFSREFLLRWAEIERKAGRGKKAKDLAKEATALKSASPEEALSRYVIDANAFR